ncbi:MAG: tetratricopeptide repeat protein, partial [Cyanobacteria bacterium]|nr:tetratricopeptide repeat protein [Cyanobacteriota bacterium]
ADALFKAAHEHLDRRNGHRLAEKALLTAYRIISKTTPDDNAKIATVYRMLGHVCCRQGKHREAMKYNALALLLQINPQPLSIRGRH